MAYIVEFTDSELRDIVREGALVRLHFAAAAARNDAGERGWLSPVVLVLGGAELHGDAAQAFGRIASGALRAGARELQRVDVPGVLAGDVTLALRMANGTQVTVRAQALEARLADGARFQPDWSC